MKSRVIGMAGAIMLLGVGVWAVVHFSSEKPAGTKTSEESHAVGDRKSKRTRPESKGSHGEIPETARRTSWLPKAGSLPELSDEQVAKILENSHRSAEALLAVSRIKNNLEFLQEAAKSFSNHKAVQLELAIRGQDPNEKRAALDRFRELDPNNAMGDYLAALMDVQEGKPDDALKNLQAAETRTGFNLPLGEVWQACEDAYVLAGVSAVEAKSAALFTQPTLYVGVMNQLAGNLATWISNSEQGEASEATAELLQIGVTLGRRATSSSKLMVSDMMAVVIETRVLKAVPPQTQVPGLTKTAEQRLAELDAMRKEIVSLSRSLADLQAGMTAGQFLSYLKHVENDGESDTLRKLRDKASQ